MRNQLQNMKYLSKNWIEINNNPVEIAGMIELLLNEVVELLKKRC